MTVGTFDGVHLGHQHILNTAIQRAQERDANSVLVTFEPHPGFVLKSSGKPDVKLLTTIEEKIDLLEQTQLRYLIISNFTRAFADIAAEDFVKNFIVDTLQAQYVVIGHDHTFGRDRRGNIDLLRKMGKEFGFDVEEVSPVKNEDQSISSTRVRQLLLEGQVDQAEHLLGRFYSITGQVIKGSGRGREMGFPTANIRPYSRYKLVPQNGIYASKISIDNQEYDSVTYIGTRPTFNIKTKSIETHIPDFDGDIYQKEVTVSFLKCLRKEETFDSTKDLINAIKNDKELAVQYLRNGGKG